MSGTGWLQPYEQFCTFPQIRDALLSKLPSGEIRVSDIDKRWEAI